MAMKRRTPPVPDPPPSRPGLPLGRLFVGPQGGQDDPQAGPPAAPTVAAEPPAAAPIDAEKPAEDQQVTPAGGAGTPDSAEPDPETAKKDPAALLEDAFAAYEEAQDGSGTGGHGRRPWPSSTRPTACSCGCPSRPTRPFSRRSTTSASSSPSASRRSRPPGRPWPHPVNGSIPLVENQWVPRRSSPSRPSSGRPSRSPTGARASTWT
ncbi:MAG: hypothetical protein MZV64_22640 [Ignavibacteriales bacterium]|nr:hypothetical protein [Ignavibacteriales bacterium]